jgi:penicillin-binding protein 1C
VDRRSLLKWAACALGIGFLYLFGKPSLIEHYPLSSAVYDRNGTLLRLGLASDGQYRLFVPLRHMAPEIHEATLLYEDRHFFWHPGVNPVALIKAIVHTASGQGRRGASTITMQVARLRFGIDSSTIPGKVLQIMRALQIELYFSKNEILEAYLTIAPYGGNIQGVGAASRIYFNKEAQKLSLAEALALAVMPQRPGERAPDVQGNEPEAMRVARERLARAYLQEHTGTEITEAGLIGRLALRPRRELPFLAPHLSMRFAHLGNAVATTVDLGLQQLIERRASNFVARHQSKGIENAAVLLVEHRSMEVLASLGSVSFADATIQGQVDGTTARRSPGSALKPFIYGLALEKGIIHPQTLLRDAPMSFGAFNPENFDGEFVGPLSATDALARSRNVPAVYLETELRRFEEVKGSGTVGGLYEILKGAGIRQLKPPEYYGLALVLGGCEVTMEELVALYAMLANNGEYRPLHYTMTESNTRGKQLLSAEAAALTLEMLRTEERSSQRFSRAWVRDDFDVAWKTGTSHGYRDAWTVGIVGTYVLAVWVGNFDSRGNPIFVGRRAAAPLFFELVEALRPRLTIEKETQPPPQNSLKIAEIDVCAVSGQIPTPYCPRTKRTSFIPGISPIGRCDIHREVRIDTATGLRACPGEIEGTRATVFEFWPSDLMRLFDQAGMPRIRPPRYLPRCNMNDRAERGRPPFITSPQLSIVYNVRSKTVGTDTIPLSATADADVDDLRWFVDERFVGATKRGESFFWKAQPGDFIVRVVDDSGRSHSRFLHVAVVE